MSRRFDLGRLFEARLDEDRRKAAPYRTLAEELDAVRAGKKAISMFPLAKPGAEPADDAFLRALLRAAGARGLGVLVEPGVVGLGDAGDEGITAYALGHEQGWRVPAIAALWKAALEERARSDAAWSDAAERQLTYLLGYSERERRVWMAQLRHRVAAWGARTVYALLDRERLAAIERLGRRCLGPAAAIEGMTLFVHAGGRALRRDAARRVPRGLAIARVGIAEAAYARLFGGGRGGRGAIAIPAGARAARALARGVRSNVEILTRAGWR
jgi:hypothetical protein